VVDNGAFAIDHSNLFTFAGPISDTGAFQQLGSGETLLTGTNTYTGGTTIDTGTLQISNGGRTGSITGNVIDKGTLAFDRSDAYTFAGQISGNGAVVQSGAGALTLSGANTYYGGTTVNAGTLIVDNANALGVGNVTVTGGILTADPQAIHVHGNYFQGPNGTLQLQMAGANGNQYDTLNVIGNAALGGTLQLISLGFKPAAGNLLTLVATGGAVSSRFAQFVNPFVSGPGFTTVDLVYGRKFVLLEFLNVSPPVPPVVVTTDFSSFAFTQNQSAAANLLDAVQLAPRGVNLISFLSTEPFANLPGDFQKIAPDGLTAFYEIRFSKANIQKVNLETARGSPQRVQRLQF
jgi:autotransporter-associated beta strand protein